MKIEHSLAATVLAGAAFLIAGGPAAAQGDDAFVVPLSQPGRPARVIASVISGSITVRAHDAAEVRIETSGGPEARRPERSREGMTRIPDSSFGLRVEEEANEVRVSVRPNTSTELVLTVPRDATLRVSTVNDGDILVDGVRGALELRNTNGDVRAHGVVGPLSATTVNGDVEIGFASVAREGAMAFTTLNGDVRLELPAGAAVSLRLRTDQGDIYSDFDVAVENRPARVAESRERGRYRMDVDRDVVATINGGGTELQVKTFNGDIYIAKR